ncbi:hypothetical protein RBB50_003637 [Rhinocladiella similis]
MASITPHEDERRASTPDEDDRGFYSKRRYAYILDLFREGQDRDLALKSPSKTPNSASTYDLRRRVCTYTHFAGGCDDESSSEEEYDPATENRRRPSRNAVRPGGNQRNPHVRTQNEAGVDSDAAGLPKRRKIVPLKVHAESSKEVLRRLEAQHSLRGRSENPSQVGLNYDSGHLVSPETPHDRSIRSRGEPRDSYLWRLDEECAGIDNANGRALRSRTIPDQEIEHEKETKCAVCQAAKKKCIWKIGRTCACCKKQNVECVKWIDNSAIGTSPPTHASFTTPLMADETMQTQTKPENPPQRSQVLNSQHVEQAAPSNVQHSPDPLRFPLGTSVNPVVLDSPPDSPILAATRDSVKQIITCWAHPINFKHAKSVGPCHFCTDFRFGIFGHGSITTEVIRYPGSTDLEETGDGHRANGKEATRMCVICALQRIYISRCAVHHFKSMEVQTDPHLSTLYAQQLHAVEWDPPIENTTYSTCRLCPELAAWCCCVDKENSIIGRPLVNGQGRGKGCGLRLCNTCKVQVEGCGGVLEKDMIMAADGRRVRADVEFLFKASLLHQAYFPRRADSLG